MKLCIPAILLVSTNFAATIDWIGTTSDLETGSNWEGGMVPTSGDIADFNGGTATSLTPVLKTTDTSDFQCEAFNFESSTNPFTFTIHGPYSLDFYGDGITGSSDTATINASYDGAMTSNQQILFSQGSPSIGEAIINLTLQEAGSISPSGTANDLAQCLFDGSGGVTGGSLSQTATLTGGDLYVQNNGAITSSIARFANDIGQVVFDGSGGLSSTASGSGSSTVTIDTLIQIENDNLLSNIANGGGYGVNDVAQLLFDGSGGVSLFSATSGGSGFSHVTLQGSANLSVSNDQNISSTSYNGNGNDLGQIIFDGSSGLGYNSSGTGYSEVFFEDGANLAADNNGSIYSAVSHSGLNDLGQVIFDGSCGFALGAIGMSSESQASLTGDVVFEITNYGSIYNSAISANVNDIAQLLFDGSAGFSSAGGGTGQSTVSLQAMDGGSPSITIVNNSSIYSSLNDTMGTISESVAINDLAQILFDGSGGLGNSTQGTGNSTVTIQGDSVIVLGNHGSMFLDNYSFANDVGQMVFDGSGGLSFVNTGVPGGIGNGNFTIEDGTLLSVTNGNESTISISGHSWANNVGQILFDGSGGANYGAVTGGSSNSGGPGTGNATVAISGTVVIEVYNEEDGSLSVGASNLVNHLGQIIFDGSAGLNQTSFSTPSQGNLGVAIGGSTAISVSNAGEILNAGTASGVGQILFDGSSSSIGTGSCTVAFSSDNTLTATNSGTVQGDQFGIYSCTITGSPTFQATNTGTLTHGVAFYGTNTTPEIKVALTGSTLYLDPEASNPQQIGSVTFDADSLYEVFLTPTNSAEFHVTSATLAGSVVLDQAVGNYAAGSRYLILQSTDALDGSFNPIVIGALPGYAFRIEETPTQVYLVYSAIPTAGLKGNALKIANAINASGDLQLLQYLDSLAPGELQAALNSVSPARNAFGSYIASQMGFSMSQLLSNHINTARESPSENKLVGLLADASGRPRRAPEKRNRFNVWATGFGEFAYTGASSQNPSFHFNSGAILLGLDSTISPQNLVGGAIGYARTHFYEDHDAGSGNINYYFASAYGNVKAGNFYLTPALWLFFTQNNNVRHIAIPGFNADARATISAWQIDPHLEVGYRAKMRGCWEMIPFSALDWVIQWQQSYTEHGAAPYNGSEAGHQSSFVRSETGLKFNQRLSYSWGTLMLKEKGSYVFEKPFGVGRVPTGFVGSPAAFTLTAVNETLNLGAFGFDAVFLFGEGKPFTLEAAYEGEFGKRYYSNDLLVTFGWQF